MTQLPNLRSLKILDLRIASVEPVHRLHGLLQLELITYDKGAIDFAAFPKLERCSYEWRRGSGSLFDCRTLVRLFVNNYDATDLRAFSRLIRLESLAILNAPVQTLDGIGGLTALRSLRLANLKRLTSLAGISTSLVF